MIKKKIPENVTIKDYYYCDPEDGYSNVKEYVEMLYSVWMESYTPREEQVKKAEEIITEHLARIEADRRAASTGWNKAAKIAALNILDHLREFPAVGYDDYDTVWLEIEGKLIGICHDVLHDIFADIPTEAATK